MNEYQVRVYFASGRMSYNIGTLIKGDYNSSKLVFDFDDDTGIKMFELLKPDGETKWIKEIVNNEIILADTDELGEVIPLLTQEGTYIFEVAKYDGNSKLTSVKGKFKVKDEQVSTSDIPLEEVSKVELDDLINDVAKVVEEGTEATANTIEQATYAKVQGDYAKEQAQIIIDANTTATKIINDFETNVDEYTRCFNTNAEEKLEVYNQNDIDKTKAYNENAEGKVNSYNENASNKLKEYNDNATTKLSEYNTNSETKTTTFDTNASEKTDAFNLNVANKTTDFDSNAEAKTTEFNDNATTKTEEYNTNAEAKVNEFNATVDELKQDVEDCYNNMLTNEVEGTSIHVEDSANARIIFLETEGNCEQVTTTGKNKLDFNALVANVDFVTKNNDGSYSVTGNGSAVSIATIDYELEAGTYYISADYTNSKDLVNSETGNLLAFNMTLEDGTSQWVSLIRTDDVAGTRRSVKFTTDKKVTRIHLQAFERFASGTITFKNVQIGSDSEYEPYTGGQPSPSPDCPRDVEVIEPYNLFDKDNLSFENAYYDAGGNKTNSSLNGLFDFIEVLSNKEYTLSFKVNIHSFTIAEFDENKNFIKRTQTSNNNEKTITTSSTTKYVRLFFNYDNSTKVTREIAKELYPLLIKGTKAKPYAPYGYIRNKFVGKNLFNYELKQSGTNRVTSSVFEVEPNTTYTFSASASDIQVINYYKDNDKNDISNSNWGILPNLPFTFTTPKNCHYIQQLYRRVDNSDILVADLRNVMSEKGEVATEFESYQENNLDINLQGNFIGKIGDVADTLRVENGRTILTKRIGKVILDGSESEWAKVNTTAGYRWYLNRDINIIPSSGDYVKAKIISDLFLPRTQSETWNGYAGISVSQSSETNPFGRLCLCYNADETISENGFKAWLSENPVTVQYVLAKPYEIDLGPVKMPKTYEGITNVSLISTLDSNMKLKYVRSTNVVVDNLAKAIVALGGEINV